MSTKIEWTQQTWNPTVGCDKVSAGCKHCYAIRMAWRLAHIPAMKELYGDTVKKGANGEPNWTGVVKVSEAAMDKPLQFKKPTMFFVDSMSDLFHESVPFEVMDRVFDIMDACPQHTFQILTKRPGRMCDYFYWKSKGNGFKFGIWPLANVWLGVSVEDQKAADERIPYLLQVPAAVRFLSCEPLLGMVNLHLDGTVPKAWGHGYQCVGNLIDWVICGGESGPDSSPMHPNWARSLRYQCKEYNIPFFFKQWGDWMVLCMQNSLLY